MCSGRSKRTSCCKRMASAAQCLLLWAIRTDLCAYGLYGAVPAFVSHSTAALLTSAAGRIVIRHAAWLANLYIYWVLCTRRHPDVRRIGFRPLSSGGWPRVSLRIGCITNLQIYWVLCTGAHPDLRKHWDSAILNQLARHNAGRRNSGSSAATVACVQCRKLRENTLLATIASCTTSRKVRYPSAASLRRPRLKRQQRYSSIN